LQARASSLTIEMDAFRGGLRPSADAWVTLGDLG
jgi:hypothetical protein